MEIDRTHKRILALLQKDGRMSAAAVGREIGLSRPAVQDRIAAMEQAGVISGYHAQVSEQAGVFNAVVFVQIADRPCDKALQWIIAQEGVTAVHSLAGEVDAIVHLALPGIADLSTFNDLMSASPLIKSARSSVVLRKYKAP